jgi:hypothetical protein
MYIWAYQGKVALFIVGTIFNLTGLLSIVSAGFKIMGFSIWDDKFSVGPQKKFPLALFVSAFISIVLSMFITLKLTDASINRALDIVNSTTLVHAEGLILRINTKEYRGNITYEADIVYRHNKNHYYRSITCDKNEFKDGQPLRLSFPADHPKMLVIDGVLR